MWGLKERGVRDNSKLSGHQLIELFFYVYSLSFDLQLLLVICIGNGSV